ncbi:MAG: 4-hydroxy-3-methylbut-2-enyl diphosphate reductase [Zoogloeaceae bacterium]|jgi:4-hydroxy-3-methylbut-2-enyl diphosphate reductase|nr:4-hydroxy-3-methylbut-2-enyl diphosphate reductase [Zoogloeaceae bacterium]
MKRMDILLANPRGFCAGVERAIAIVERVLEKFGPPVYVRHEVVHNKFVCDGLRAKGAIFVEELEAIPSGSVVVFSAHGVSNAVRARAKARNLEVFDATCPLVTKVHVEIEKMRAKEREIVMIGHKGHPEVEGAMGQSAEGMYLVENAEDAANLRVKHPQQLSYVTQTTLSIDDARVVIHALRQHFPDIQGPKKDDICYATQNRQDAVKTLARQCGLVIIVGSQNSSNSKRLKEVAAKMGAEAYLIDTVEEIQAEWLAGKTRVGVSAGASAPEALVKQVIEHLQTECHGRVVEQQGVEEKIHFPLPKALSEVLTPENSAQETENLWRETSL